MVLGSLIVGLAILATTLILKSQKTRAIRVDNCIVNLTYTSDNIEIIDSVECRDRAKES